MNESDAPEATETAATEDGETFDRRDVMAKLVAAAALAATGLVSGEAGAQPATQNKVVKLSSADKVEKWNESFKFYKDSTVKLHKLATGFRVEIQATPELGSALRSMGLVPSSGPVKLSIEFSSS